MVDLMGSKGRVEWQLDVGGEACELEHCVVVAGSTVIGICAVSWYATFDVNSLEPSNDQGARDVKVRCTGVT